MSDQGRQPTENGELTITINGLEVPSQNRRDRWHWRQRTKHRTDCEIGIMGAIGGRCTKPFGHKVKLTIVSVRKQRMRDHANLVGGCKSLVDAVVNVGLLADDDDEHVEIEYQQQTRHGSEVRTILRFTDLEAER